MAHLASNGGSQHPDKRKAGGHTPTLADVTEHELLPTPAARDWKSGASNIMDRNARPLNEVVQNWLPPTPLASDGGLDRGSSAGYGLRNVTREIARDQIGQTPPSGAGREPSDATRQASAGMSEFSDDGLLPLWSLEEMENPA